MLIEKSIEGFIKHLQSKERSKETIRGYNLTLLDFKRYIEKQMNGQVYLDEITLNNLEGYLEYRKGVGDQPVSRNRTLYIFRSFYDYLVKRDIIEKDISQKLEPIKLQQKERLYLLPNEVETLLDAIDHPIIKPAATTLAYTGLRVSELCNLTLENVDLDRGVINVKQGKGNKDRTVPLNEKLQELLKNYVEIVRPNTSSDRFFATAKTGKLSPQYINRCLKDSIEKLGWTKHVTAHILRHSFASTLVRNNASLPAVQSILGHSDLRVTSRYIHQNLEQLRDAVNLI
jgi:integrase/recombinase XerD